MMYVEELAKLVDGREEFLCFMELEKITRERIALTILEFLKGNNLPVVNMHGQG